MVNVEEWQLKYQNVIQTPKELLQIERMNLHPNVTLGLQFKQKRKKLSKKQKQILNKKNQELATKNA